jgi:hypothetical protein
MLQVRRGLETSPQICQEVSSEFDLALFVHRAFLEGVIKLNFDSNLSVVVAFTEVQFSDGSQLLDDFSISSLKSDCSSGLSTADHDGRNE